MANPGELLRASRRRHGVSQRELAIRASTTQSAISRIERNKVSPSVATLEELLFLLGEDLIIEGRKRETGVDVQAVRERLRLTPGERIERGIEETNRLIEEATKRPDAVRGASES